MSEVIVLIFRVVLMLWVAYRTFTAMGDETWAEATFFLLLGCVIASDPDTHIKSARRLATR